MTVSTLRELSEFIDHLIDSGDASGFAFAIVKRDGIPVFGHANASYDLLGAIAMCQAGLTAKLVRGARDHEAFPDDEKLD